MDQNSRKRETVLFYHNNKSLLAPTVWSIYVQGYGHILIILKRRFRFRSTGSLSRSLAGHVETATTQLQTMPDSRACHLQHDEV